MSDRRSSGWRSGLVLGFVSGLLLVTLGIVGLAIAAASLLLIAIHGPRALAAAGFTTGLGLVWTVLFARVALTCGGPFDPGVGECAAGDLSAWIVGSAAIFGVGLMLSALALRRTMR